jgi:hypothetical protein
MYPYRHSPVGIRFAAVVFALAACGGRNAATQAAAPAAATASAPAATLTLAELKFYEEGHFVATLGADGQIRIVDERHENMPWKTLATLARDGSITRDGKPVGRLELDGAFERADGSLAAFRIDGFTLAAGDTHVTIDEHGVFSGNSSMAHSFRVDGVRDDGARRAALLVFALASELDRKPDRVERRGPSVEVPPIGP